MTREEALNLVVREACKTMREIGATQGLIDALARLDQVPPKSEGGWRPISEAPPELQKAVAYITGRAGEYRTRLCHYFDYETRTHHCWAVLTGVGDGSGVTHYLAQPIPTDYV